ncbi:MAG: hypothetical protein ACP5P6_00645 [Candidatus Saccharicenans sp.]
MKILKMILISGSVIFLTAAILNTGAKSQEKASAQNYLPVRVLENDQFLSGLQLSDFELLANGQPQKIEGLLEIHKKDLIKQEGNIAEVPEINRSYFLLFQMYEYQPQLLEALNYFFSNTFTPGDQVQAQTPMGNYRLNPNLLASNNPELAAKQMNDILKKDINMGNSYYQSIVRDLKRFVQGIEGLNPVAGGDEQTDASISLFGLERLLSQYRDSLQKLESLRMVDENKLVGFAELLKRIKGEKILYFVYQQEYRPEISSTMLNTLISNNQDNQEILSELQDLFQVYHRELRLDQDKVVKAFSDSGTEVHFLFVERIPEKWGGLVMREQSEDIFKLYSAIAGATGGGVFSGKNLTNLFQKVEAVSRDYYLLFYRPEISASAEEFINLKVSVNRPRTRVLSRAGYYY